MLAEKATIARQRYERLKFEMAAATNPKTMNSTEAESNSIFPAQTTVAVLRWP